jgi:hypothetical protein
MVNIEHSGFVKAHAPGRIGCSSMVFYNVLRRIDWRSLAKWNLVIIDTVAAVLC